jgi:hypothetical protein
LIHTLFLISFNRDKTDTHVEKNYTKIEINLTKNTLKTKKPRVDSSRNKKNELSKKLLLQDYTLVDKAMTWSPLKAKDTVFSEKIEQTQFYLKIWERINESMYYPEIFVKSIIEGGCQISFFVKPDGTIDAKPKLISGSNDYINSLSSAIIQHALRTPLHPRFHNNAQKLFKFTGDFTFYISYIPGEVKHPPKVPKAGEYFYFYEQRLNLEKSSIKKAMPKFLNGGMLDLVYTYKALTGKLKKEKEEDLKKLKLVHQKHLRGHIFSHLAQ